MTTEKDNLIELAEKYADKYGDDDRQDIKTDVLNAYYAGSEFYKRKDNQIIIDELRPMSDLLLIGDYATKVLAYKAQSEPPQVVRQASDLDVYNFHSGNYRNANEYIGWIPMPIYKGIKSD